MPLLRSLLAASIVLVSALTAVGQTPAETATGGPTDAGSYATNPKWVAAMREGKMYLSQRKAAFAKDAFNKANKIAGGSCLECMDGLYSAQLAEGDYKGAIETTGKMEALATSPFRKSMVEAKRGDAILAKAGEKPKPEQLEQAHEAFQQALTNYPQNLPALYRDGETLARMGKMDEAKTCFTQCVALAKPTDPASMRAAFCRGPDTCTEEAGTCIRSDGAGRNTLQPRCDGRSCSADRLLGDLVRPLQRGTAACEEDCERICGRAARHPECELGRRRCEVRQFIGKNEMTWMQYRDASHALSKAFGVEAIPHYFVIDTDGGLTTEMVGSGSNVEGKLKKLIAKAHEAQKQRLDTAAVSGGQ